MKQRGKAGRRTKKPVYPEGEFTRFESPNSMYCMRTAAGLELHYGEVSVSTSECGSRRYAQVSGRIHGVERRSLVLELARAR